MALGTFNSFTAGTTIVASQMNANFATVTTWSSEVARLDGAAFTGACTWTNTITVGADGTGYDVKFFGDTTGRYMQWDQSQDELHVVGTTLLEGDNDITSFTGTTGGVLKISNNQYDAGDYTALDFGYSGSANPLARIAAKISGSGTELAFGTSDTFGSGITNESLTIIPDGTVTLKKPTQANNTITVGENDTGYDVIFYGDTASKKLTWDTSADALLVEGAFFAKHKLQTGQTTFQVAGGPYFDSTISLGAYGSIGTQGSYRTSITWNYERGADNAWHHLDINSYPQAGSVEIGDTGILFQYDPDYETTHTAVPATRASITDTLFKVDVPTQYGVDGTGYTATWYGDTSGSYMRWDQANDDLYFDGDAKINLTSTTPSSANYQIGFAENYHILADNQGTGSDSSRIWISGNDGGNCYIGPRASGAVFDQIHLRGDTYVVGALSKTSGTFDIPHPVKDGDWRLRHSFIEGPTCDNIYRGTAIVSGGSVSVDLDAVSNMTDGTWEALNTNPWSMVSSSGNAVTWSLSGKILTIEGPDEAVCCWMVIGERKDPTIIESSTTDESGKLVTEYENPDINIDADE